MTEFKFDVLPDWSAFCRAVSMAEMSWSWKLLVDDVVVPAEPAEPAELALDTGAAFEPPADDVVELADCGVTCPKNSIAL
jgi:hypothetical protein